MTRQFLTPLFVPNGLAGTSTPLTRIDLSAKSRGDYDESWLQELLFTHPDLLPISELSREHGALVPLCREMETGAGPIDLVYVNEQGLTTLVECKLWRNPGARREVVGQILEYAAHVSGWTYEQLRDAVGAARRMPGDPLYASVAAQAGSLDEHSFIDDVQRCLETGRFLLLVVGDGIRENIQNIAELLRRQSGLGFTFGLVEMAIFRLPSTADAGFLVQPRLLANSVEIVRDVVQRQVGAQSAPEAREVRKGTRIRLSENEIRDRLREVDPGLPDSIFAFLDICRLEGLQITIRRSLMIHHVSESGKGVNFGTFYFNGDVNTNYIVADTEQLGDRSIGERYLEAVAGLIPNAAVQRTGNTWTWRVVVRGQLPAAKQLLCRSDEWLACIAETRDSLRRLETNPGSLPD